MSELPRAKIPFGRVYLPGEKLETIRILGIEYLIEDPEKDSLRERVRAPEMPIIESNPSIFFDGSEDVKGPRPEVQLRQALKRCLRNRIDQERIQEIVDLETTKHIMDS